MTAILFNVLITSTTAKPLRIGLIIFLVFANLVASGQNFILYQMPADAGYSWEKLNKELAPIKTLPDLEKTIRAKVPKFTGELIVLSQVKGTTPFLWIMTDAKKVSRFDAPILDDQPARLNYYSDLEKVYFRDTLVILDSLLIDIMQASDFTRYNYNDFYFRTDSTGTSENRGGSRIYRVPTNQYKKLNIKQAIFGPDAREYVGVEVFNVLLPDKIYGSCILYFPSPAFKKELLKKAKFLRDNAGFTLPDITGVLSLDLQRKGTSYYKSLLNWLRSQLADRK